MPAPSRAGFGEHRGFLAQRGSLWKAGRKAHGEHVRMSKGAKWALGRDGEMWEAGAEFPLGPGIPGTAEGCRNSTFLTLAVPACPWRCPGI